MSLIHLSLQHGTTLIEAKARLRQAVEQLHKQMGALVQNVTWTKDDTHVVITGVGFVLTLNVDEQAIHLEGSLPLLGKLLGSPVLAGVKRALEQSFQKRLTE